MVWQPAGTASRITGSSTRFPTEAALKGGFYARLEICYIRAKLVGLGSTTYEKEERMRFGKSLLAVAMMVLFTIPAWGAETVKVGGLWDLTGVTGRGQTVR